MTLLLEGLSCPSCGAKIEAAAGKLPKVQKATLNFIKKTLELSLFEVDEEEIKIEVEKIVGRIEPDVKVRRVNAAHDENPAICSGCGNGCSCMEKEENYEKNDTQKNVEHGHSHGDDHELVNTALLIRVGIGIAFLLIAVLTDFPFGVELGLFILSYLLIGADVLWRSVKNIIRGDFLDENFLMSLATLGAFATWQYPEAVSVMLFYQVGEFFQDYAVNLSRKNIADLIDIRPDYANIKSGDEWKKVNPEAVKPGDVILIRPGEKVPLDGIVMEGSSSLDTTALTGESLPGDAGPGDRILSGSINQSGALVVKVEKSFGESTASKILELVENAAGSKAATENFITKFARIYTPAVVAAAILLAVLPPLFADQNWITWLNRALIFLVVSCPCALVLSIPLSFFGGLGAASRNGILIKGSNYLDALNRVERVVFDKTGTLTRGVFQVSKIMPQKGVENLLELAAYAEHFSNHPIAQSIKREYGDKIDESRLTDYREIPGQGISVLLDGRRLLAGNRELMQQNHISCAEPEEPGTLIHIAKDGQYAGWLLISDQVKPDSKSALSALKSLGIRKTVMLTGDRPAVAHRVAADLGIDEVHAGLLPQDKVEAFRYLKEKKAEGSLVFVGDGLNDAPVLAMADVGIAMGGMGSDAAIEAADVVLMTDEPMKLVQAIKIARYTHKIVLQNIIFALAVKGLVLILGAGGLANLWEAVFADVGVALIAVLNAMRILRKEYK